MTEQIKELESKLTGNIFKDAELIDEINKLKGKKIVRKNTEVECIGCGS